MDADFQKITVLYLKSKGKKLIDFQFNSAEKNLVICSKVLYFGGIKGIKDRQLNLYSMTLFYMFIILNNSMFQLKGT